MNATHEAALAGRTIIVTGAAQGIGEATSLYLAEHGANVVVADVKVEAATAVADSIVAAGGSAAPFGVDVTSWEKVTELISFAADRFGGLNGVVNNAGVMHHGGPLDETGLEGARRLFEVNLLGTYAVGVAAIQYMAAHGGGAIVNITSGVQAGLGSGASYSASKGGVASLTYSWAIDCLPLGIRVNAVSPVASTEMVQETERILREKGQLSGETPFVPPARNAVPIAYLLSDLAEGITGQVLRSHDETLQLIAHPVVMQPEITRAEWTIEEIDSVLRGEFGDRLPPLGLAAAEISYGSISKVNVVPGIDLKTGGAASGAGS